MTFDELWRLDLAKQQGSLDPIDKTDEIDLFDCLAFNDSRIDRIDEEEVTRFIQKLEESTAIEGLVKFTVTFYGRFADGGLDPMESLSVPRRVRSVLCSQTARDEQCYQKQDWIYFVALEDVDSFEQTIALCKDVISFERSLIPGDCAKTKTFFIRRNNG